MSKLYARITKIDEAKRLVYGIASAEEVDAANEIFDYDGSKPYIQAWSNDYMSKTDGLSAGNLRAMHKPISAGKLLEISFDDANKIVHVIAKIVDDGEWGKVVERVYTGFSFGGHSVKKWLDTTYAAMRYILKPNELSLADSPCVKSAIFYEVIKIDGTVERHECPVKGGEKLKNNILKISVVGDVAKSMYSVKNLAGLLQDLQYLQSNEAYDAQFESANSPLPAKLKQLAADMAAILIEMVTEETTEMIASMKLEGAADIQKAGARNNKNDQSKLQTMHDHAVSLGAKCEGGVNKMLTIEDLNGNAVLKTEVPVINPVKSGMNDVEKVNLVAALNRELEPIQKMVDTMTAINDRLSKIEKMELPPKAAAAAIPIAKIDDVLKNDKPKTGALEPEFFNDLVNKVTLGMNL